MEEIMRELTYLCVRYNEMYMFESAVRNCEDKDSYVILVNAYQHNKEKFDEQYSKVENLIKTKNT